MAVTYKDIDLLTQKSAVVGTEKLPVSDTEYITPDQIAGRVTVDDELSRTSENPVQNKVITLAQIDVKELTPTSTVTGKYYTRTGGEYSTVDYNYNVYSVSPGRIYAVSTAMGGGYSTGYIRAVVWLDSNGDVLGYSEYENNSGGMRAYINRLIVAPAGAVTAIVNYRVTYAWGGKLGLVAYETNAYVGAFAQTLSADEKAQARANIGAANAEDIPNITVSSSEPTAQDGSDGDIWIVV